MLRAKHEKGSRGSGLGVLSALFARRCLLHCCLTAINPENPRGSAYTFIRELGPIIPSIVWYFGA